jgi:hypothetical protein
VTYFPRIVDAELSRRLAANGAVVIEGPKACGKTETARQQAASEVLLDVDRAAQQAAEIDPRLVLDGPTPRLLDEWQIVPAIWNNVRREIDSRGERGLFLLTGSATPADDETRHTGGLRFGRVQMRPMSLVELARSTGEISLSALLAGDASRSADPGSRSAISPSWSSEAAGRVSASCRFRMPRGRCATTSIASGAPTSKRSTACVGIPSACRRSCEASLAMSVRRQR